MGLRTQDFVTLEGVCPACGGLLTTPRLHPTDEARYPASPATVRLCVLCVARVLVQATLAIHGEPSPHAESNRCPGHEDRMRAHEERVQRALGKHRERQGQGLAAGA